MNSGVRERFGEKLSTILILCAPVPLLIYFSFVNFLLFHVLAEVFSVIVAFMCFMVTWQTHPYTRNHYLPYLGNGLFWIAAIDLVHTFTYKGMNLTGSSGDTAIQLWIVARYLQSLLLLTAPFFISRSLSIHRNFMLFGVIAITFYALVMSGFFPVCFIEGEGLTPFKIYSEYIITTILLFSIVHLLSRRKIVEKTVLSHIIVATVLTMLSELAFTLYVDLYGLSNIVGHLFKYFAFVMIFKAIVQKTLTEPYTVLETRVEERTTELKQEIGRKIAAEEKLKNSRDMLSNAQRIAHIGSWEWNIVGNTLTWTDEAYRIAGVDPESFKPSYDTFIRLVHPDDRIRVESVTRIAKFGSAEYNIEYRIIRPGGELRMVHQQAETFYDDNGFALRMVGSILDITDRKRIEDQLLRHQASLVHISEKTNIPIEESLSYLTGETSRTMDVACVSVWRLVDNGKKLRCLDYFDSRKKSHIAGLEISDEDYPSYFSAVMSERIIPADDVLNHPATSDLKESYLVPLGIGAMLDVIFEIAGKKVGVLCFEHIGSKRNWTSHEISFALSAAKMLALRFEMEERRLAEEALERAKSMLTQVLDTIPVRVFWKGLDGVYLGCNTLLARDAGFESTDEVIGKNDSQMGWKDRAALYRADDIKIIKSGVPKLNVEEQQTTLSGETLWLETNKVPLKDSNGNVIGLLGTYDDITVRKTFEVKLKESEERFRSIYENSSDAIFIVDPGADRIIDVSPRSCELLGYAREDLLEMPMSAIHPGEMDRLARFAQSVFDSGKGRTEELHCLTKGGVLLSADISASVCEIQGSSYMIAMVRDITQRKKDESELRKLRNAIEQSLHMVVITNRDGVIEYANPSFEKTTGYLASESIGHKPTFLKSGKHDKVFYKDLWSTILQGKNWSGKLINRRKNGELYHEGMTISPVKNDSGEVTHFVAIKSDITEMIKAEEELKAARASAEDYAGELKNTLEVSENLREETERAKEMAERMAEEAEVANKAKSEFLANMSHELRTPLNGIIGLTGILLAGDPSPDHRNKLSMVKFSGESLLALVNDILDLSKIEAGKFELDRVDFDLRKTVEDTGHQQAVLAHRKGLEFLIDIAMETPSYLIGDPGRLQQIIINLVGNAIKFTEKGEVFLRVWTESQDDNNAVIHFCVKDTGIGIPKDQQDNIFQRFTQADGSTTRKYGGSGLGVTIASQLVEMMGGEIWLTSEEGAGSEFHFTTTLVKQLKPVMITPAEPEEIHGLRALIVDDNDTNLLILKDMVSLWGIISSETSSGKEAIVTIINARDNNKPFDLLLLDYQMPGMNGLEVALKLMELNALGEMKIILLTSVGSAMAAECQMVGISDYLFKPVKQSALYNVILKVLGKKSLAPEDKEPRTPLTNGSAGHLKVLLVEDNIVNQEVAIASLERFGHEIVLAENGQEAIEKWDRGGVDLVLMDVQMPVMGGIEATEIIRAREKEKGGRIPIIAMTAKAMAGDRERCISAGMDDYISKPIDLATLEEKVNSYGHSGGRGKTEESIKTGNDVNPGDKQPVYDLGGLRELLGGNENRVRKILGKFVEMADSFIPGLTAAVESGDAKATQLNAHTLKGAASQIGASRFQKLAREFEVMGAEDSLGDYEEKLAALKEAGEELLRMIKAEINS